MFFSILWLTVLISWWFLKNKSSRRVYQYFSVLIWFVLLVFYLRKSCLYPGCKDFSPRLSSGSLIILTITFMSLIHFELIWGYVVIQKFDVHFFPYGYLVFQHQLLKRLSLPPVNCLIHCLIGRNWKLFHRESHSDCHRLLLGSDRKCYQLMLDCSLTLSPGKAV